jgi:signal transduction histidine kinase
MLDVTTIFITTVLVFICMTSILWIIWRQYFKEYQGVGYWVLGTGSAVLAFLFLAMRGVIPLPISALGGITLLSVDVSCILVGLEKFFQLRSFFRLHLFCVLATFIWQCLFLFVVDDVHVRIAGFSSIWAVQFFWGTYRLVFQLAPKYRAMARFTAVALFLHAGMLVERIFYQLSSASLDDSLSNIDPTRPMHLLVLLTVTILLIFSFLIMLFNRQNMELERKTLELEEHRRSLQKQVREQSARLIETEKVASIGILAAGVGHEISNPAQVIDNNLSAMNRFMNLSASLFAQRPAGAKKGDAPADLYPVIMEGIALAREACGRISRIVNDLRDFSRFDDTSAPAMHDLRDIVRTAARFSEQYLKRRTRCFQLELPDAPLLFSCRSHQVEQVVINLLKNAADSLASEQDCITIRAWQTETAVHLRVRDTGLGIAPERLSQVTSPFYTTKREKGGTGLGLYMATRIVERHDGALNIQSEPGQGTIVEVVLPKKTKGGGQ